MPPKVKSRLTPESQTDVDTSATPPAKVVNTPQMKRGKSMAIPTCETPSKVKRGKSTATPAPGTPKGRPSKASTFIAAVATKCKVHQDVVMSVLDAVESMCIESLKSTRKFHVSFIEGKLHEKKEILAMQRHINGKLLTLKAKPARRVVKLTAAKTFQKAFE